MPFSITSPSNNARFPLGEAVEFNGTADHDAARVELTIDNQFTSPTVTITDGEWSVANRFNLSGVRPHNLGRLECLAAGGLEAFRDVPQAGSSRITPREAQST